MNMPDIKTTRKIQLTGGSTYIVSLPKEWVKYFNLKAGDEVDIRTDPQMRLVVSPKELKVRETKAIPVVHCERENPDMLVRDVIAFYMASAAGVEISSKCLTPEEREMVKNAIRGRLLGAEIVDESSDSITIQFVVSHKDLGINTAINRAFVISSNMLKDDLRALKNRRPEEALDVKYRDNEVDRFYFYVVRLLSQGTETLEALKSDGYSVSQVVNVFSVIRSVERISDHAYRIAENVPSIIVGDFPEELVEWGYSVLEQYSRAMNAFLSKRRSQASEVIAKASLVREEYWLKVVKSYAALPKPEQIVPASLISDSLNRITRYSMDIAEATIDALAKAELERAQGGNSST